MTHHVTSTDPDAFVERVTLGLTSDSVITDPDVMEAYRRDEAGLVEAGMPVAVVLPTTTAEVVEIVDAARESAVPLVPRGAGSGLAGGANAVDGAAIISTHRMDRVLDVSVGDLTAVVQPGVLNADLSEAAADEGLWYPPDPASWEFSTIGGNVATNAGGLCCVKYGVTGDAVLALEVVLADGSVIRPGRRTAKGVAGYDLVSLFVGSEGTLGIITEITVRLRPARQHGATLIAAFPSLTSTGTAMETITSGVVPALLEVLDQTTIRAIDDWKRMDLDRDAAALLIAQSDLGGLQGEEEIATIRDACENAGATYIADTTDPAEADLLLAARRLAYPALERLGTPLLDDVAVPRSRITDLLRRIGEISDPSPLVVGTFGHAGDGNLHPTIVFDDTDPDETEAARDVFDRIVGAALDLGGTITGEHGVGLLKREHLLRELGEAETGVQRAIKHALDPDGLLNPGKVF